MRVGITAMLTDRTISPVDLARDAEGLGFDSLFLPEHTHMPVDRSTEHPLDASLPDAYRRTLDPFVALGMAAAVTSRLLLGTGILLLAERDPIVTAKEIATLDHLSGGRFVLGLGYGWNREELEDHGVRWQDRRDVTHERLGAMQALWRDEVAVFDGQHVSLTASWAWPKPVGQTVPVWMGVAAGPRNLAAVAQYAEVWMPHGSSGLADGLEQLRRACEGVRRPVDEVATVPFGVLPTAGKLEHLATLGIQRLVALIPSDTPDAMRTTLHDTARTLDDWSGGEGWRA